MNLLGNFDRANAVVSLLDHHVEKGKGSEPALHHEEGILDYASLLQVVCQAGNLFSKAGIEWEDRVAIILPDCAEHVISTLALIRIGAAAVPVSTRLSFSDYLYIFADCRPRAAIVAVEHVEMITSVIDALRSEALPVPRMVWVIGKDDLDTTYELFSPALSSQPGECPVAKTSRDDMALIQYTSGSTGQPKGVVHLHRGLLEIGPILVKRMGISRRDRCFSAAKLSFGYGLGNSVLIPFSAGASSVLYSGLSDPFAALGVIDRYSVNVFFGVPGLYAAMLKVPRSRTDFDLSSLRLCVSAGEHLNPAIFTQWREQFGLEIIDGIGSTECLHIFICGGPGRFKPGSTGTVVEGNEVKLLDETGQTVKPGEPGELYVKSKSNAARYWNRHEETAAAMIGPWTRTGDWLYQDQDGYFYYLGRKDDVIKVGGMKVSPVEIEECLARHHSVRECAVVGVTTEEGLNKIRAYIRLNNGWEASRSLKTELKEFVCNSIAAYKCPGQIEFVSDLPRTTTGKIARCKLRENTRESL